MKASEWRDWLKEWRKQHSLKSLASYTVDKMVYDLESLEAENAKLKEELDMQRNLASDTLTLLADKSEESYNLTASLAQANARLISLQAAATMLLEKCDEADANGDLPEIIDGFVLDLVRSSISAQPKGDISKRIAQEVLGECPLNDEEAMRLALRILSAIAGVEK